MNYQDTIDYLFLRLPMFSRIGTAAFKKDLTNTIALCEFLGNPQEKFKSIHVAGTNGKGSVSHMLASVLQSAGYKTGLYTSPHLKDFRERIKINGEKATEGFIVDFTERIKPVIEKINPSFFEITVAMAFEYFAQNKTDIVVIEVGLGGRFDSTNIINPELSVITNIGMDHMNILGETLEKIAFEKAGIIKQNTPVVIGEHSDQTLSVFQEIAMQNNATLHFADTNRSVSSWEWKDHLLSIEVSENNKVDHKIYKLDLLGIYQNKNLLTVLEAVAQLNSSGFDIPETAIAEGLHNTKKISGLHGRWEIVHEHPLIILDVAHNEDGIKQVVQQLELSTYGELYIIFGIVKDKEIENVLSLLPKSAHYYFAEASIPRALPASDLYRMAQKFNLIGKIIPDVNDAIREVRAVANNDDLILVGGSVFLVGEVNTPIH